MFRLRHITLSLLGAVLLFANAAQAETWRMASKMPADSPEGRFSNISQIRLRNIAAANLK